MSYDIPTKEELIAEIIKRKIEQRINISIGTYRRAAIEAKEILAKEYGVSNEH